jgi:hypothetical protein
MANQKKHVGFCFRCSAKHPHYDAAATQIVHNPWPLLAWDDELEYMRSQPLIRACYTPLPLEQIVAIHQRREKASAARLTTQDQADFQDWFNLIHEIIHLWQLEWTPAKELAKTYLATSYTLIAMLISEDNLTSWLAEATWNSFQQSTDGLAQIAESIGLVEELFATAITSKRLEERVQPKTMWAGFQDELAHLTQEALQQEEKSFFGFCDLYERVLPLVDLMRDPHMRSMLTPILQPVVFPEDGTAPYARDAVANLKLVLQLVEGKETLHALGNSLRPLIADIATGWKDALWLQQNFAQQPLREEGGRQIFHGRFSEYLWKVCRGTLAETPDATTAVAMFLGALRKGEWLGSNVLLLEPQRYRRRDVIGTSWYPITTSELPPDIEGAHYILLFFEGLRQQLLIGKGIVCPFSRGSKRCRCSPQERATLLRLSALAVDGAFGPGEWSLLPCKHD